MSIFTNIVCFMDYDLDLSIEIVALFVQVFLYLLFCLFIIRYNIINSSFLIHYFGLSV